MPESKPSQEQPPDGSPSFEGRPAIVIDKEGDWFYNGLQIINRQILLYFCKILEEAPDGGFQLKNGAEVYPVEVQDAPFVVTSLWPSDGTREEFFIKLNDDSVETLAMETLAISAENIPYCRVKQDSFKARFLRTPYYRLAESVQQDSDGMFFIELNGQRHYLSMA